MGEGDRVILLLLVGKNINYAPCNSSLRVLKVPRNESLRVLKVPRNCVSETVLKPNQRNGTIEREKENGFKQKDRLQLPAISHCGVF